MLYKSTFYNMENEIWKLYVDTSYHPRGHKYEVSYLGRLKIDGIITEPRHGHYLQFGHNYYLHIAVATLFVPNPYNKTQVDHIDGNKYNNKADNLRWVTPKENMANENTKIKIRHPHKKTELLVKTSGDTFRKWNQIWNRMSKDEKEMYRSLPKDQRNDYIASLKIISFR